MKTLLRYTLLFSALSATIFAASVTLDKTTLATYASQSSNFGAFGADAIGLSNQHTLLYLDFNEGEVSNTVRAYAHDVFYSNGDMFYTDSGYGGSKAADFSISETVTMATPNSTLGRMGQAGEFTIDYMLYLTADHYTTYGAPPSTYPGSWVVADSGDRYFSSGFFIWSDVNTNRMNFKVEGTSDDKYFREEPGPILLSNWVHIVNVYESDDTMSIFTNGGLFVTGAGEGLHSTLSALTKILLNSFASPGGPVMGYVDNLRITDVAHSNASTNMLPLAGMYQTTNLNAEGADVALLSISVDGRIASGDASNAVEYSLDAGANWQAFSTNMDGIYFDPRTNAFNVSNALQVRVIAGTSDDRNALAMNAVNVNYFNPSGTNAPDLGITGVTSQSVFTTKNFPSEFVIELVNTNAVVSRIYSNATGQSYPALRVYLTNANTNIEVTNVSTTNNVIYVPFPAISNPSGKYSLFVDNTAITGKSQFVSNVLEVFANMPAAGALLSPYEKVVRNGTMSFEYYSMFGDEGTYELSLMTLDGKRVYTSGEQTITGIGSYTIDVDLTTIDEGRHDRNNVLILVFRAGTKVEQSVLMLVK